MYFRPHVLICEFFFKIVITNDYLITDKKSIAQRVKKYCFIRLCKNRISKNPLMVTEAGNTKNTNSKINVYTNRYARDATHSGSVCFLETHFLKPKETPRNLSQDKTNFPRGFATSLWTPFGRTLTACKPLALKNVVQVGSVGFTFFRVMLNRPQLPVDLLARPSLLLSLGKEGSDCCLSFSVARWPTTLKHISVHVTWER